MKNRGFTLIELITAVSIFIIVMMISMTSILGVFDGDRKSRSLKAVMTNLNLAMETMSREMRFGRNYHCGAGDVGEAQNCPDGDTLMSFYSSDNTQITYRLQGTSLEKDVDGGGFVAVTAPEVTIDSLTFYTLGAGAGDTYQPKVVIKIAGRAGVGRGETDFALQTLVSQRALDDQEFSPYTYPTPAYAYPTPASPEYTLTVSKGGSGSGVVSGPGIDCGSTCSNDYTDGSEVTLTASPSGGSNFSAWSGACTGSGSCVLSMTANRSVTATFNAGAYDVEYLVVGGGGGGGSAVGGGGGGGDVLTGTLSLSGEVINVTVGAGGSGGSGGGSGSTGGSSIFSSVTASGGGGGGAPYTAGGSGANGGGGGRNASGGLGGAGGFTGGAGDNGGNGDGQGAGGAGDTQNGNNPAGPFTAGNGGEGRSSSITGTATVYGSGGGGGQGAYASAGNGGSGAGGGGTADNGSGGNGLPNRGGGGGGGGPNYITSPTGARPGGNGGSGIVVIRYAGAQRGSGGLVSCLGGGTPPACVGYTVHTFTGNGTYTP